MNEPNPSAVALAPHLYAAYLVSCGGLAWDGRPCPTWDGLNAAVRAHWTAAAQKAIDLLALASAGPTDPPEAAPSPSPI
jgi:hypothetical protein